MGKLTFAKIKALRTPGRYGDGGTLFLNVAPGGSKSWVQRLTVFGVRRDIGLGGWPLLSLAAARVKAFENRKLARIDDGDPLAGRRRAKMRTFEQVAREAHEANRARWSRKHAFNWLSSLERFAFPVLGRMPVDRITGQDVLSVLGPIPADTARRVRQRIRTALGFALGHGYVASNAAGADLDGALPAAAARAKHFRALPYRDVAAALETVEASGASWAAKGCFRFLVLTACRSGEARGATWSEIDLEAREWRIPAERMKSGAEHRVPLSDAAVAVLERMRPLQDPSGLVFPSPRGVGRPLSGMTLIRLLRDCGLGDVTVHGLRAAFPNLGKRAD